MSEKESRGTYVQLSKPFFSAREIEFIEQHNADLRTNIRNFKSKSKDVFQALIRLCIRLNLPLRVLQNSSYFYQKFYLLNNNYKKYSNLHYEVGLAVLFISLKLNDYIKKVAVVITEALAMKEYHLTNADLEENKKIIVSLERKILEFQSFDFRNFLAEDYLIKFLKHFSNNNTTTTNDKDNSKISYLVWSTLNDLYLTSLVVQYPAHYNALISINCGSLIFTEIAKTCPESATSALTSIDCDFKTIYPAISDNTFLLNGTNQLLEYFIDNLNITFLRNCLYELGVKLDDKQILDILINIKIEVNAKIASAPTEVNDAYLQNDMFFLPRDTDIAKNGSLRFIYKKSKYTQEMELSKK